VDANGVLVLLKFLNQDFSLIKFDSKLDHRVQFLVVADNLDLAVTMEKGINSLLRLMYKCTKHQRERIKANLLQYKAHLIMNKLLKKFELVELRKNAAKIIKI
jgi:hypothetical protein